MHGTVHLETVTSVTVNRACSFSAVPRSTECYLHKRWKCFIHCLHAARHVHYRCSAQTFTEIVCSETHAFKYSLCTLHCTAYNVLTHTTTLYTYYYTLIITIILGLDLAALGLAVHNRQGL
jgi:hypothetical protein